MSTGNAPLIPAQFGLSPDRVRALTSSPITEIAAYHEAMAETASDIAARAGMAKGQGLHAQAENHRRWARTLRELLAHEQGKTVLAPKLRMMKGGRQ